jgi:hypothetical protein
MKLSRFFLAIVLAGLTSKMSHAQQPTDGLPQGIEALRQIASSKTEFLPPNSMQKTKISVALSPA